MASCNDTPKQYDGAVHKHGKLGGKSLPPVENTPPRITGSTSKPDLSKK